MTSLLESVDDKVRGIVIFDAETLLPVEERGQAKLRSTHKEFKIPPSQMLKSLEMKEATDFYATISQFLEFL